MMDLPFALASTTHHPLLLNTLSPPPLPPTPSLSPCRACHSMWHPPGHHPGLYRQLQAGRITPWRLWCGHGARGDAVLRPEQHPQDLTVPTRPQAPGALELDPKRLEPCTVQYVSSGAVQCSTVHQHMPDAVQCSCIAQEQRRSTATGEL
jgi:hypothetical protein